MKSKPCVLRLGAGRIGTRKAAADRIKRVLVFFLVAMFLLSPPFAFAATNTLEDVSFAALPGGAVQITLTTSSPVAAPSSFTTEKPARIALDFADMESGLDQKTQKIGIGMVESVTAVGAGNRMRVVVNLVNSVPYGTQVHGNRVVITVEGSDAVVAAAAEPAPHKMTKKGVPGIENIDFRRGTGGEGRVIVVLDNPATVIDVREEGGRVLLDFKNTALPRELMERLDVTDFATPVNTVETRPMGKDVRMEIKASGEYDYMAYQADDLFTVEFQPLSKAEKEALQKEREVFEGDRLSLNFQDIEVRAVLQLLADFTGGSRCG